jgi:hypothetical protein
LFLQNWAEETKGAKQCMKFVLAMARGQYHSPTHSFSSSRASKASFLDVELANGLVEEGSFFSSFLVSQHISSTTTQVLQPTSTIAPLRLVSREESTRVQLQKQRIKEQHRVQLVGNKIPGFKTSASKSVFFLASCKEASAVTITHATTCRI